MVEGGVLEEQPAPQGLAFHMWAKSLEEGDLWMPLWRHLDDTAAVADALWLTRMSRSQRELLARELGSEETARRLAVWLAAVHDIGKASGAFAMQVPALRQLMESEGFHFPDIRDAERRAIPHSLVSKIAISDWFAERGIRHDVARAVPVIVGGHHGVFSLLQASGMGVNRPAGLLSEREEWAQVRAELIDRAVRLAGIDFVALEECTLSETAQAILTGFLIQCDWIASNADAFTLSSRGVMRDWDEGGAAARAARAVRVLGLPEPWRPELPVEETSWFHRRFALGEDAQARPSQMGLIEAARTCTQPSLLILEAPTGEGKTEAALAAAEVLAAKFGLAGVFIGLPSRATSDAMFARVLAWMDRTLPAGQQSSAVLSHGLAEFNDDFAGLAHHLDDFAPIYDETSLASDRVGRSAVAHWWLRGRKKSILANFVVGTIDQLLFLALKSRHLVLRHLGMSGKVVILDELHASDDYMLVYLERALEWLGAEQVPVIGLSATLSPERRRSLLAAYERGRARAAGLGCFDDDGITPELDAVSDVRAYPVVLASDGEQARAMPCAASARRSTMSVEVLGDDLDALVARVCADVAEGGCVAIVRNTVARAQEVYARMKDIFPSDEVLLLHSRFLACDRRELEQRIMATLGPRGDRPHRLIACATQVIEQSLDLDFDRMYTDWAPIDLIIQRAGRVHRHARDLDARPEVLREARLVVTGIDHLTQPTPPTLEKGAVFIYGAATLLRSAAAWRAHEREYGSCFVSPDHVAALVRGAYDPAAVPPPGWEEAWVEAESARQRKQADQRAAASTFVIAPPETGHLEDWSRLSAGEADEEKGRAQVRDADESLSVVVVQRVNGVLRALPWLPAPFGGARLDGMVIPDDLARTVARCSVTLPARVLRGDTDHIDRVIDALEANGQRSWQDSRWLRGALPLVLDENCSTSLGMVRLTYDRELGLT